jgi:hypothetical protein
MAITCLSRLGIAFQLPGIQVNEPNFLDPMPSIKRSLNLFVVFQGTIRNFNQDNSFGCVAKLFKIRTIKGVDPNGTYLSTYLRAMYAQVTE